MAHLRQSGPSFGGIVDTLDTSTSSKSNVKMTDQKHMSRIPTWKTGTVADDSGTGVAANSGTPLSYSHSDFPNTGDQVSMSDFRSIFANVTTGQASRSVSSLKTTITEFYTGFATTAGMAAVSANTLTNHQRGSALSEGTTYTTSGIPMNNAYGSPSIGSNVVCEAIIHVGASFSFSLRLAFSGTGASSISSGLDVLCRGNGNLLQFSSSGPDGTWTQTNTSPNGGFNPAVDMSSVTPTKSTAANGLTVFVYTISSQFHIANLSGGQANFTAKIK
tara:strand:- start:234 stop:1058 length:825 start_codon:yes stop_codon:yes gene_type:complete